MPIIKNPTTISKSGGGEDKLPYRISNLGNYTYENNEITHFKEYAFYYDDQLVSVSFPSIISVRANAFNHCISLTSINFPISSSIGSNAFQYCTALTSINFPLVTSIGSFAFGYCTSLISASFPVATSIENSAFSGCTALTSINFPLVTIIKDYAFQRCSQLTSIDFPAATTIRDYAFANCSALTSINFPLVTIIRIYAFSNCTSLISASFPSVTTITNGAFEYCRALTSITLGNTSQVCTLADVNAFPVSASHHVNIYVPINLIASYRTATNWSTLYNNGYISILPIDGQLISVSNTNGTYSGDIAIANNGTATVTLSANSGYELPSTITVTGASYTYNQSTGVVSLSNPTAEVNVSCVCSQATPSGYNLTINSTYSVGAGGDSNVYVKLNGYATRASDYDYYIAGTGLYPSPSNIYNKEGVLQSNPLNLTEISSIQIWADDDCDYNLNNAPGDYNTVSGGFNNRVMINLTENSTIDLIPYIED